MKDSLRNSASVAAGSSCACVVEAEGSVKALGALALKMRPLHTLVHSAGCRI